LPRGGEGHQGLPCLSACVLVCFHLRFHASILPCVHAVTCQCSTALSPSPPEPWLFLISFCLQNKDTRPRPRPRPRGPLLFSRARCFVSASHCHRRHPLYCSRAAEGSGIQMKNMSRDPPETTSESLLRFAINEPSVTVVRQERDQFALLDQKTRPPISLIFLRVLPSATPGLSYSEPRLPPHERFK
jgi:hypothetical protein